MKKSAPKEKLHATYSASGSKMWLACPGSIPLSKNAPPGRESRWADEGTQAHEVVEYLIKNRAKRLAAVDFLRRKYPLQMIVHAESTLNYVEKRLSELPGAEVQVEVRCDLPVSERDQFGTTDIAILDHFGKLIVIDYKYGAGIPVSVVENGKANSQLVYYALGLAHKYDYNFSDVEIVVVQPRAAIGGQTIRSHTMTVDELILWRDVFEKGIAASKEAAERGVEKYLLSGDHCRFCPAKVICPEIKNLALRQAQADFDDETGEVSIPMLDARKLNFEKTLPALEKLEIWIKAVREHAEGFLEDGGRIPGYALVETRPSQRWVDYDASAKAAEKLFGEKAFTLPELLSPAQFREALKKYPAAEKFLKKNTALVSSGVKLGKEPKKVSGS